MIQRLVTAFATAALCAVLASPAGAARISKSPYVFDRVSPSQAVTMIRATMKKRFGTSAKVSATCKGMYPGSHDGVTGWHEIHCIVRVVLLSTLGYRGIVIYYIDQHKHAQDRQHLARFTP